MFVGLGRSSVRHGALAESLGSAVKQALPISTQAACARRRCSSTGSTVSSVSRRTRLGVFSSTVSPPRRPLRAVLEDAGGTGAHANAGADPRGAIGGGQGDAGT